MGLQGGSGVSWIGLQCGKVKPVSQKQLQKVQHICTETPWKLQIRVGGRRKASLEALSAWTLPWLFFHYPDQKKKATLETMGLLGCTVTRYSLSGQSWQEEEEFWWPELEAIAHTVSTVGSQRTRNPGASSLSTSHAIQDRSPENAIHLPNLTGMARG